MKFLNVVGARPNFMKIAPFQHELAVRGHDYVCVHTGQHYDERMSDEFFEDLNIHPPDYNLEVGSNSHAKQTGEIMKRLDSIVDREAPDWVVVVGDVNSTLAGALVATKKEPKLAHIEGGIRSGNRQMPEEINRILVDSVADAIFCFDQESVNNLEREAVNGDRVWLTGDIMIDSLHQTLDQINGKSLPIEVPDEYGVVTLHRPCNVDNRESLEQLFHILRDVQEEISLIFPMHPRTEQSLKEHGLLERWKNTMHIIPPLSYQKFVSLMESAEIVLTDSGSIQQETTVLNIPCLTLRNETERAVTIRKGTNVLTGLDKQKIIDSVREIRNGKWKNAETIQFWDGQTAKRIVDVLSSHY